MQDDEQSAPTLPINMSVNPDVMEARFEARESHKYLLAKSYFDCREFERCAAVFLPSGLPKGPLSTASLSSQANHSPKTFKGKSKNIRLSGRISGTGFHANGDDKLLRLSQKALFLALYAKYLAGEKKKDEESEMILGPADRTSATNKHLVDISRTLEHYFAARESQSSGGWLEYLYGIVLAKGKSEEDAKKWLVRSVHLFPYNWGAWLELNDLIGSVEEVMT
jgi:anaphase-promoting complex subunit 8